MKRFDVYFCGRDDDEMERDYCDLGDFVDAHEALDEVKRLQAENASLVEALETCRSALEPYDDIKPRNWVTDRLNLLNAHKVARSALARAGARKESGKDEAL